MSQFNRQNLTQPSGPVPRRRSEGSKDRQRPELLTSVNRKSGAFSPSSPFSPSSFSSSSSHSQSTKQKPPKAGTSTSLNSHVRSISRSVNDIFARSKSPSQSDSYLRDPGRPDKIPEIRRPHTASLTNSGRFPEADESSFMTDGGRSEPVFEGWLNVVNSHYTRKGALKDAWKLHFAVIHGHLLSLYKPPPSLHIRSFDIHAKAPLKTASRPQTAPDIQLAASQEASTLRHNKEDRHPDLVLAEDGSVVSGSVEAICHEILFGSDDRFFKCMLLTLPAWTIPETALAIFTEYAKGRNICGILDRIVTTIIDSSFGMLLEMRYHESLMALIEKGIKPHSPQLAAALSGRVENKVNQLRSELFPTNVGRGDVDASDKRPALSLSPNEFLSIPASHLAQQIHAFHKKYLTIWNPGNDTSLLMDVTHALPAANRNPLVFTSNAIHFLGEKLCMDILMPNHSHEFRASLLSHWIDVGGILQDLGDMVGWFSIIMAILSPAILRLQMTWQMIEPVKLQTVIEEWVPVMLDLERRKFELSTSDTVRPSVMAPGGGGETIAVQDIIPYFGDLCHSLQETNENRDNKINCKKFLQGYEGIEAGLERWSRYPEEKAAEGKDIPPLRVKEDHRIQQCLRILNDSSKSISVYSSSLFQMSLAAERPNTGVYVQPHYHQKPPLSTGTSIPLAFTELLPGFSLFNWEDTLTIAEAFGKKHFNASTGNLAAIDMEHDPMISSPNTPTPVLRRTRSFPPPRTSAKTTGYNALDVATHERTAGLQSKDNTILRAVRDVLGVDEESFYSKDGELVLKADANLDLGSRPSSLIEHGRRPLSIASGHADSGDRPPSLVNPYRPSAKVLNMVTKGGTLERLVDILVLGVQDFSARMFTRNETGEKKELPVFGMDEELFIITFLATFRSFCLPIVLLEYLKKRLLGARSAAKLSDKVKDDDVFPDWTGLYQDKDEVLDWPMVARIHLGILRVLSFWVEEFYIDFHGDLGLRDAFLEFITMLSKEFTMWENQSSTHEELPDMIEQIFNLLDDVREQFERSFYLPLRPSSSFPSIPPLSVPVHCPLKYLEEFVDQIENYARRAFQEIRLVDWMITFEILEMQSTELNGFLVSKSTAQAIEDDDVIQNVFLILRNLPRVDGSETVFQSIPPAIRAFALLQSDVTLMIISMIADTRINADERSQRIFSLLRCIALCQRRMSVLDIYGNTSSTAVARQSVPSFVGNAIATALCSPESRMFAHAWGLAGELATGRNSDLDTLQNVIPVLNEETKSQGPMTVCPCWLLDRMLEIICNVPNMLIENSRLINFDKRRYVFNLVSNFFDIDPNTPNVGSSHEDNASHTGHERQPPPSRSIRPMDRKHLKEFAFRENAATRSNRTKVFSRLVQKEHDKRKRDWKYRESVEKQQRGQLKASQKHKSASLRMDPASEKKSGRRLAVNTLFKAVRPISMAISSTWTPPTASRVVPPGELPVMHSSALRTKPVIMIDLHRLSDMHSSPSFRQRQIWKLKTEDGLSFLFQATGPEDTQAWLHSIEAVSGEILRTDGDEALDAGMSSAPNVVVSPSFGVSLEKLYLRDGLKVPYVVEAMLGEVERRGLDEVGIYRVPGATSSINALKQALDSEVDVRMDDDRWFDINAIAGAFKLFMREMPNNLLSPELLEDLKAMPANLEDAEKPVYFRSCFAKCPPYIYFFLQRFYRHLHLIAENSAVNKMNTVNLAIVFGMGMANDGSGTMGFSPDFGYFQQMVRTWITHAETIFPDPPPEEVPESPYMGEQAEMHHPFTIPVIVETNAAEDG
ncbi:rho GTPase-activating protein [Orbilia brochopaga]|uniref:Rho GTPase-activating protein n=1 Tax=Orbilia brochopaga TaxID=3140254 RepID=A0AAV9UJD8_9PEZI